MDIERLKTQLERHEGKSLKLYEDSVKKLTVGVGRNIEDRGISDDECDLMLENDIQLAKADAEKFPWFHTLDDVRQNVIVELIFNLGLPRFSGFKKAIAAIEQQNYKTAAAELLDSKWSVQVGNRALRLAEMMRSGLWPN